MNVNSNFHLVYSMNKMFTIKIHSNASATNLNVVFWATRGRVFSEMMLFFGDVVSSENPKFTGHGATLQGLSVCQSLILGEWLQWQTGTVFLLLLFQQ